MKRLFPLIGLVVLIGCKTVNVTSEYDYEADFTKYKTYEFTDATESLPLLDSDKEMLIAAVERELKEKGMTRTSDNPDALVRLHIKTETVVTEVKGRNPVGGTRYTFASPNSVANIYYDEFVNGTLFITLADRSTETKIWRGAGSRPVKNLEGEVKEGVIDKAVALILKKYPPKKKKKDEGSKVGE